MKDNYVTAVLALLVEGVSPDTVFTNLKSVMAERGHSALLLEVLTFILSVYENMEKMNKPTVIVANAKDAKTKDVIKALVTLGAEKLS